MQNQEVNELSGRSRFSLLRLCCDIKNLGFYLQGLGLLVLSFVSLMLYLFWDADHSHRNNMPIFTIGFFIAACVVLAVALDKVPQEDPTHSKILIECFQRCFRRRERSPSPVEQHIPPTSNSSGDSAFFSSLSRSLRSIITSIVRRCENQDESDELACINCCPCLNSSDQVTSVTTPENLPHSSTDPSGETLPLDAIEMAVLNPEQQGPSQQVQADVINSADSVQKPTEDQTHSKADSADLGTNLAKDGKIVVLNTELEGPSSSQRVQTEVTNSTDLCQYSDVQEPTEKQTPV